MTNDAETFLAENPETVHVDAFITDLAGRAMGKRFPASHLGKVLQGAAQLCAANTLLDVTGNTSDPLGHGFSDGDPDAYGHVVAGTLKPVPWAREPAAQCLLTLKDAVTGEPVWFEPRVVLERVLEKFSDLKLTPVVASELEFYLIDRYRDDNGFPQTPVNPRTGQRTSIGKVFSFDELDDFTGVLDSIASACAVQDIPASTSLSEFGTGQFEVNLSHTSNVLKAADDACLLKRAVIGEARRAEFDATFMAKPFANQSGNGMHVHVSLLDAAGNNAFAHDDSLLKHAVGGLQATMGEAMAIFAPNLNAYRRRLPDHFVPVTTDWGDNNRSVAFRIPASGDSDRRLEHRAASADANPYLVIACVLAGIHHGIVNRIDPGPKHTGNAGASVDDALPATVWQGLDALNSAKVLPLYFGSMYIAAYEQVKRAELSDFLGVASRREFDWYL